MRSFPQSASICKSTETSEKERERGSEVLRGDGCCTLPLISLFVSFSLSLSSGIDREPQSNNGKRKREKIRPFFYEDNENQKKSAESVKETECKRKRDGEKMVNTGGEIR